MRILYTICCCSILLILAGCRTSHSLVEEQDYARLNEEASKHRTIVELRNGQQVSASLLRISPTEASWVDTTTGAFLNVPTGEIKSVQIEYVHRSALEGMGFGLFGGVLVGAIFGLISWEEGYSLFEEEEYVLMNGLSWGIIGGVAGLVIGAMSKSWNVYHVPAQEQPSRESVVSDSP